MKRVLAWLFPLLALSACTNHGGNDDQSTLNRIRDTQKLRVGYIPYFEITSRDPHTGKVSGFMVDVLSAILDSLTVPDENVEFVETDWQNFSTGLNTGKFDFCIAGTFNTPVRANVVNFTRPLFSLGNGAVVKRNDTRFSVIDDFDRDGVTIAVVQGEQGHEYVAKHFTKATVHVLSGSDLSLAPLEVSLGKADAAFSDQYILRRYCNEHPDVMDALATNPYGVLPICWSVRKDSRDSTLLNILDASLSSLEVSGGMKHIVEKYPSIPFVR